MGQKPAETAFQASDYTIRIMLRTLRRQGTKVLPSNSRARRRQTSGPLQGLPASKPVRGPRTLRSLVSASVGIPAALHPSATSAWKLVSEEEGMPGRKVPVRVPSVLLHRPSPAGSLSAVRESLPPKALRLGSARHLQSCVRQGLPHHFRHRSSAVRLRRVITCLLFLQALCLFRLVRGPRCAAARRACSFSRAMRSASAFSAANRCRSLLFDTLGGQPRFLGLGPVRRDDEPHGYIVAAAGVVLRNEALRLERIFDMARFSASSSPAAL